jgi:4-hydroxy-4-methyl-2-oxoglutarate aldolase
VIVGDADGVVAVPRGIAEQVLLRGEEIVRNEKIIFGWVAEGQTIEQITRKGGYF